MDLTGNKGFTLIEILISLLVLSIGLLSVAAMQLSAIEGNSNASHITEATALIQKKLDGYKALDYDDISDESGTEDIYTWTTTVDANSPANNLKTISVDISWSKGDRTDSLSFGTIIAKK
jgi:type IV pilus assembly protein PilV